MNTRAHLDICMYWLFVVECCVVWCTAVIATVTGENIRVCVAGQRQDRTNNWEPLFNVFMFFFSFFFSLTHTLFSITETRHMHVCACLYVLCDCGVWSKQLFSNTHSLWHQLSPKISFFFPVPLHFEYLHWFMPLCIARCRQTFNQYPRREARSFGKYTELCGVYYVCWLACWYEFPYLNRGTVAAKQTNERWQTWMISRWTTHTQHHKQTRLSRT